MSTTEIGAIDTAIEQVERLYQAVTGKEAPAAGEEPSVSIPPERSPEDHLESQIDRLAEALQMFRTGSTGSAAPWAPPLSIWESATESLILLDLPGIRRETVRLSVVQGMLAVAGERSMALDDGDGHLLRYSEQVRGPFRRVVPLPQGRTGEIRARLRDGVLEIRVPRAASPDGAVEVPIA